ncbi:MAG: dihydrodipicolinate synthase family protein, partial [Proteobacteria bacterium]|nr:dihydrodipicolinate synthase family protein [Pseudomonadota bacterium]
MVKNDRWENIFPAICTPFNEDYSLNEGEFRNYVRWLASLDLIDGLVCNGHTGEITSLNRDERRHVTEVMCDEVGGKVTTISGVSAEGTLEAIEHAKDAQKAGANGILMMPPHNWLRFGMKQEGVVQLFTDVASAIDIGIIIHLYPYTTKAFYPVETIIELAKIPNVKTLKMGTRQMAVYERDVRLLRREAPDLTILTCHDEYLLTSMYVGVDGALIGFGGCIPEVITEAWRAMKEGDFAKTRELQEQIFPMAEAIYGMGQPSGEAHARMKEALKQRGVFSSALMRPPVLPLTGEEKARIFEAVRNLKEPT